MKKSIVWLKLWDDQDLSVLLIWLGLIAAYRPNNQVKEHIVNNLEDRKDMKLAQLESYLKADDNQGLVDLSLYF